MLHEREVNRPFFFFAAKMAIFTKLVTF